MKGPLTATMRPELWNPPSWLPNRQCGPRTTSSCVPALTVSSTLNTHARSCGEPTAVLYLHSHKDKE